MQSYSTFEFETGTTSLSYRRWGGNVDSKNVVIIAHRGYDCSGSLSKEITKYLSRGYIVFDYDLRGYGDNCVPGCRLPKAYTHVNDFQLFTTHLAAHYGLSLEKVIVCASELLAPIVVRWLVDFGGRIAGLILVNPVFKMLPSFWLAFPVLRVVSASPSSIASKVLRSRVLSGHEFISSAGAISDPILSARNGREWLEDVTQLTASLVGLSDIMRIPLLVCNLAQNIPVSQTATNKVLKQFDSDYVQVMTFTAGANNELSPGDYLATITSFAAYYFSSIVPEIDDGDSIKVLHPVRGIRPYATSVLNNVIRTCWPKSLISSILAMAERRGPTASIVQKNLTERARNTFDRLSQFVFDLYGIADDVAAVATVGDALSSALKRHLDARHAMGLSVHLVVFGDTDYQKVLDTLITTGLRDNDTCKLYLPTEDIGDALTILSTSSLKDKITLIALDALSMKTLIWPLPSQILVSGEGLTADKLDCYLKYAAKVLLPGGEFVYYRASFGPRLENMLTTFKSTTKERLSFRRVISVFRKNSTFTKEIITDSVGVGRLAVVGFNQGTKILGIDSSKLHHVDYHSVPSILRRRPLLVEDV